MGRGRKSKASTSRNAEVHEPIAKASERIAAAEVTRFFLSCCQPKTESARSESSHATTRISRLASRCLSGEPNARRASAGSRPCAAASSKCEASSSSMSRFTRSPRNEFASRVQSDISNRPQNAIHRRRHGSPTLLLRGKLLLARGRQFVDTSPASRVFGDPLGANPTGFLHAVQGGVKRTLLGT